MKKKHYYLAALIILATIFSVALIEMKQINEPIYIPLSVEESNAIKMYDIVDIEPKYIDDEIALFTLDKFDLGMIVNINLLKDGFRIGYSKFDEIFIYYLFDNMETHRFSIYKKITEIENNTRPHKTIVASTNYEIINYYPIDIETSNFDNESLIHKKLEPLQPNKYIISVFSNIENY